MRPRTLPLAAAPIGLAGGLAAAHGRFHLPVFGLALGTALALQITSNLANDLGDALKGTDDEARLGPKRAVAMGWVTPGQMKIAVGLAALASMVLGLALVLTSQLTAVPFIALGGVAVLAALGYTLGRNPYGYAGLGDVAVFVFFGLVGVEGAYTLIAGQWDALALVPGAGVGLLATGVLNINNIRDQNGDRAHGKHTMVVRLGDQGARRYHLALIGLGCLCLVATPLLWGVGGRWWVWLPVLLCVPALRQALDVARAQNLAGLNPYLGKLSMLAAAWGLSLGGLLAL